MFVYNSKAENLQNLIEFKENQEMSESSGKLNRKSRRREVDQHKSVCQAISTLVLHKSLAYQIASIRTLLRLPK